MKRIFLSALATLSLAATAQAFPRHAPIANDISCAQAQAFINQHDFIYTRIYGSTEVVPRYGFRPACSRGHALPLFIITADTNTCVVGHYCQDNSR